MLFDGEINGQPRKLLAQASRNGWFFVLDRTNGKNILQHRVREDELDEGPRREGSADSRIPRRSRRPTARSSRRIRAAAQNWPPPSFSPDTGLFYANATRAFSVYYLYDNEDDEKPQGWGGNDRGGWSEAMLQAIDYKTGKIAWSHKWDRQRQRPLGPAEHGRQSALRRRCVSRTSWRSMRRQGTPLWHAGLHTSMTNGPITYELDGMQYVVVGAGDTSVRVRA